MSIHVRVCQTKSCAYLQPGRRAFKCWTRPKVSYLSILAASGLEGRGMPKRLKHTRYFFSDTRSHHQHIPVVVLPRRARGRLRREGEVGSGWVQILCWRESRREVLTETRIVQTKSRSDVAMPNLALQLQSQLTLCSRCFCFWLLCTLVERA